MKKGFITIGLTLIMLISMPFASTAVVQMTTTDQIYQSIEAAPRKEIGLVLGAAVYGERLSDILRDRVDTGIELYETEKISALVVSGSQKESSAMKKYAVENGIPGEAVIEDPGGLNTLASVKNISNLNRSVIIVTQNFHLPRALFMANRLGVEAIGVSSDKHNYVRIIQYKQREILAVTKAMLDLFVFNY
jgi:vancomycin permeability regulator SanA